MGNDKHTLPANDSSSSNYHIPVLLRESIEGLNIQQDGVYVDCTFGGGGHSSAILKLLGPEGKLIAFDQDADASRNLPTDPRVVFIAQNFRHLQRFLRLHKISKVNGILADLGVSSFQFDQADRGFSTRLEGDLDMRMDQRQELTAFDVINTYTEQQLHNIFEKYGEVTNSKTLARTIVQARQHASLKTISNFKQALSGTVKGNPNKYFAQVFQALRIEVNDEFGALKELLIQAVNVLNTNGRMAVITFHSLEDRIVKNYFKRGNSEEAIESNPFGQTERSPWNLISKKPILPEAAEIKLNPRSRSAKLRIAEKVGSEAT